MKLYPLVMVACLSACTLNDPLAGLGRAIAPLRSAPAAPLPPGAELAERACLTEAREGFDVVRVSRTMPVTDADGRVIARDVMVEVRREGRTLDVRCRYDYAAGTARMMVL